MADNNTENDTNELALRLANAFNDAAWKVYGAVGFELATVAMPFESGIVCGVFAAASGLFSCAVMKSFAKSLREPVKQESGAGSEPESPTPA